MYKFVCHNTENISVDSIVTVKRYMSQCLEPEKRSQPWHNLTAITAKGGGVWAENKRVRVGVGVRGFLF